MFEGPVYKRWIIKEGATLMKPYRYGFDAMMTGIAALFLAVSASANSSWVWISETRPYDILPVVILLTLAAEVTAVLCALKNRKVWKVLFVVTLANLLSFAAPYLCLYVMSANDGLPLRDFCEKWPAYTVGIAFLAITLLVELPIVWLTLRRDAKHKGRFGLVIVAANLATTGVTALAEHLFCRGHW